MNGKASQPERVSLTDGLLDRWVDGELEEQTTRFWLSRMDDEPEGWRRLALAFVEGQRLRLTLGEMVASPPVSSPPVSSPTAAPRQPQPQSDQRGSHSRRMTWLATACGVLLGVLATLLAIPSGRSHTGPERQVNARELAAMEARFAQLVAESYEKLASEEQADAQQVLNVSLGVDETGHPREWSFPIAEDQAYPGEWYEEQILTAAEREELALSGRTVREVPGVIPVALPDGRTAVVPVKSVRVRPASPGDFQ